MKRFYFADRRGEHEKLTVTIPEKADPAYGMYVWPCAVVLAQYIWYNRKHLLVDKDVLELGAGTALPGIVAAKCANASSLALTDDTHQPRCIENCKLSCSENSIPLEESTYLTTTGKKRVKPMTTSVKVVGLRWGETTPQLFKQNGSDSGYLQYPDIILGSDCFFDESIYERVLFTVRTLFDGRLSCSKPLAESPRFLCTYQMRSAKSSLDDLLCLWGLRCKEIPLSEFEADGYNIAESEMPGNHKIQMLEISMK